MRISGELAPRPQADEPGVAKVGAGGAPLEPLVSAHVDQLRVVVSNPNPELCIIGVLVVCAAPSPPRLPCPLPVSPP
jgi:hypothetical protein